jgi:single-strand DNA-binding protein
VSKLNRYQFIGNLGADATVRQLDGSTRCAISFNVAVTEKWKNQRGEQQEKTSWVACTLWREADKTGIAQYLRKGQMVLVEGQPSARPYVTKENYPAASLDVTVQDVQLIGGAPGATAAAPAPAAPAAPGMTQPWHRDPSPVPSNIGRQPQPTQPEPISPAYGGPGEDEDLPF